MRMQRRMQRLQDERIHLEGLLAFERSLLAQQQADNITLRQQLQQQQAELFYFQSATANAQPIDLEQVWDQQTRSQLPQRQSQKQGVGSQKAETAAACPQQEERPSSQAQHGSSTVVTAIVQPQQSSRAASQQQHRHRVLPQTCHEQEQVRRPADVVAPTAKLLWQPLRHSHIDSGITQAQ